MYSFEIYTLGEDKCHDEELFISKTYSKFLEAFALGKGKCHKLSKEHSDKLVELNIWDSDAEEYIEERTYLNGEMLD